MRKVYKVVNREGRKRVSAQAPNWRDAFGWLVPFIRTYVAGNHRKMMVAGCMAFRRVRDARHFVAHYCQGWDDERDGQWQPEIWMCQCESALAIKVFADGTAADFLAFAEKGGQPDGWTTSWRKPPRGTLYCKNLRLVKRID